jgi:hypothetical protein
VSEGQSSFSTNSASVEFAAQHVGNFGRHIVFELHAEQDLKVTWHPAAGSALQLAGIDSGKPHHGGLHGQSAGQVAA